MTGFGETRSYQPDVPNELEDPGSNLTQNQLVQVDEIFKKEVGFTRVIELLQNSRKPIIGHNMQFDAAFIYE